MLISACPGLKSQELPAGAAAERVVACTDRTMYVSGENVMFTAVVHQVGSAGAKPFSRSCCVELITPDGKKIAGRKYLVENSSCRGCFTIPEEVISGVYFLRFYTRMMRNGNPGDYACTMLKIVNPFKTEVLPGREAADTTRNELKDTGRLSTENPVEIVPGKKHYSPREEIRLNFKGIRNNGGRLCLSVVPELSSSNSVTPLQKKLSSPAGTVYLPETRGVSLSGKLTGKESGRPVPHAKVNLSIIGDRDIMVVRTDSAGRFFFALPDHTGNRDIFLCADDMPGIKPEILIDNDFCTRPVDLPSPMFNLNEEESKTAYRLAVNSRIISVYGRDTMAGRIPASLSQVSFYGEPSEVFFLDKFIELPTLEEYFSELPVMLKVRKEQGQKHFRFYTTQEEMSIYDPLVLVDWVAVNDIEKVLAMSPREIERIEMVNSTYIKGNIIYGGIVSFVSKKNDFAGINLPTSGTFVNYTFLEPGTPEIREVPLVNHMPDSRNTVYWNPDIQLTGDGTGSISFTAPDTPGRYVVLLRKVSDAGVVVVDRQVVEIGN